MRPILSCRALPFLLVLVSMSLLAGCESKEVAPFSDGDYFEYRRVNKEYTSQYQIARNDEKSFTITWLTGVSEPDELIIDLTGKIIGTPQYPEGSLARDLFHGRQIALWLPTDKRVIGEHIHFADFIDTNVVTEERKWKKWNVWVTRHSNVFGWQENYYDKETGFLVGSQSDGGDPSILEDSSSGLEGRE